MKLLMQLQEAFSGPQCPSQDTLDGMAIIMVLTGVITFITLIWGCMPAGYGRLVHHVVSLGTMTACMKTLTL